MENKIEESSLSLREELEEKFEKISSLAVYCEKPPQGWFSALGEILGLYLYQIQKSTHICL